ncbi:MAG: hypothetical protein AB7S26_14470 [Sandaracinaceae bacterium]
MSTPSSCPTCATRVPEGATRCPGCGRVFGEENRCPSCNAIAAVIVKGQKTVCAACGKPRAGNVTLDGRAPSDLEVPLRPSRQGVEAGTSAMMLRARSRTQRLFGTFTVAGGVLAAAGAMMVVGGAWGLALALLVGAIGVGSGAFALRAGARSMERARDRVRASQQASLRDAARETAGRISAARAAEVLGVSVEDADRALTEMIGDGSAVDVEVDDDGRITYVFAGLAPTSGVRVGIDPSDDEAEPDELDADPAAARRSAER